MLRVASFKFNQANFINDLLSKYRLASGAHIMVSDGQLIIPYEDGEPMNIAQRIIDIKEQKNKIFTQMDIIEHSQEVLTRLKIDSNARISEAEANLAEAEGQKGKAKYDRVKECTEALTREREARKELDNTYLKNVVELTRLNLNVDLFDKKIAELTQNHG